MFERAAPIAAIALILAGVPALAAGPPDDQAENHPACLPGDVVDNEDVRIWFHGAKFQLKLFKKNDTNDETDGKYQYKSMQIAEQTDGNETLAHLKLENANPQNSECSVTESANFTNVTYTATETVRSEDSPGPDVGEAVVEFEYHFNHTDDSAKFDLNVQDWPWQSNETELAYEFDATSDWAIEPAENGLGFRDEDSGESEAFIEWALNATAKYDDGHNETVIVDANTTGSDHATTTNLRFTNVTAGYEELDYDPRVASGAYIIVANVLIPLTDVPDLVLEPVEPTVDSLP